MAAILLTGQALPADGGVDILPLERNGRFFRIVGQETLPFSAFLDPRLMASWLDCLELEAMATVGYDVVAVLR
jgi:hypothetical protein